VTLPGEAVGMTLLGVAVGLMLLGVAVGVTLPGEAVGMTLLGVAVGLMLLGVAVGVTLPGLAVVLTLPGVAVVGSSALSKSSPIANKVEENFRFLLPTVAFSRGKKTIDSKGKYSPKHVKPAIELSLTAIDCLGLGV
jgi:hypothetical protein